MLNQRLQQKLLQKLSPQQIQVIKLLEIPTMQLEERIKKEMDDNPALEEEQVDDYDNLQQAEDQQGDQESNSQDEFSVEDYIGDDEIPGYRLNISNYSKDDKREEIPFSTGSTFHDYLEGQLGLRKLDERQLNLSTFIIGNMDDDGYLRREIEAIADDIAFTANIETTPAELEEILKVIQDFDPPGVGARNLQECLLLQVAAKNINLPEVVLAEKILQQCFDEFTRKHYDKIISRLGISEVELKLALDEILKLNPKPGSAFSDPLNKSFTQIVPDFILENVDGDLQLSLHARNVPELRVSREYQEMLKSYSANRKMPAAGQREAVSFVKQKLDSARWFIDAIRQRQNTMLLTMEAILKFQHEYFLEGDEARLRPMILKDIAEMTGFDISTISRVANSKYIQSHFGIYPLKYFFSEGMQTDSGEEVSTREIKKILAECIDSEDKRNPVTDERLAAILNEKGYPLARRTVAKYRELLNIPVARMRKEL